MDFFQNATDDQIALMGCFVALVTSAALMYVSVFLSRTSRKTRIRTDAGHNRLTLASGNDRSPSADKTTSRKVA